MLRRSSEASKHFGACVNIRHFQLALTSDTLEVNVRFFPPRALLAAPRFAHQSARAIQSATHQTRPPSMATSPAAAATAKSAAPPAAAPSPSVSSEAYPVSGRTERGDSRVSPASSGIITAGMAERSSSDAAFLARARAIRDRYAASPGSRDVTFLGLHSDPTDESDLDPYGTLREKTWSVDIAWIRQALAEGQADFLAACSFSHLPFANGLNPVPWTVGHVAFTFDSIVADPLRLPKDAERQEAWKFYDSMRIGHAARWAMHLSGQAPDAAAAQLFLAAVHRQAEELAEATMDEGGALPPAAVERATLSL